MKMVLCDAHRPFVIAFSQLMVSRGHQLSTHGALDDALKAAISSDADVFVMEPDGVDMSGIDAVALVHGAIDMPLVVLTSDVDVERSCRMLAAGAASIVFKVSGPANFELALQGLQSVGGMAISDRTPGAAGPMGRREVLKDELAQEEPLLASPHLGDCGPYPLVIGTDSNFDQPASSFHDARDSLSDLGSQSVGERPVRQGFMKPGLDNPYGLGFTDKDSRQWRNHPNP